MSYLSVLQYLELWISFALLGQSHFCLCKIRLYFPYSLFPYLFEGGTFYKRIENTCRMSWNLKNDPLFRLLKSQMENDFYVIIFYKSAVVRFFGLLKNALFFFFSFSFPEYPRFTNECSCRMQYIFLLKIQCPKYVMIQTNTIGILPKNLIFSVFFSHLIQFLGN